MRMLVTLSDEMADKVEKYAKKIGVTKSSLCATFIGQSIMGFDSIQDAVGKALKNPLDIENRQVKL